MKGLIRYLEASGFDVIGGEPFCAHRYEPESYFEFRDTEEEQPEVLVWCLNELTRLYPDRWSLCPWNVGDGRFAITVDDVFKSKFCDERDLHISGKTMTACAVSALASLPVQESRG